MSVYNGKAVPEIFEALLKSISLYFSHSSKCPNISKLNFRKRSISKSLNRIRNKEKTVADANSFVNSQSAFNANPHKFANRTVKKQNQNTSAPPEFSAEKCETHFKNTYTDPLRDHVYHDIPKFRPPKPPDFPFNTKKLT